MLVLCLFCVQIRRVVNCLASPGPLPVRMLHPHTPPLQPAHLGGDGTGVPRALEHHIGDLQHTHRQRALLGKRIGQRHKRHEPQELSSWCD